MSPKMEDLLLTITDSSIKVVSFDIFDTLLLRPVIEPIDLFKLVGKKLGYDDLLFTTMRTEAEKQARRVRPFGSDDISLEDIYIQFQKLFNINDLELQKVMQTELETEMKYLYPRKSVQYLFNKALALGKEVIITSDMYLSESFLRNVLKKNGYDNYSHLYLSSKYKKSKGTGRLYEKIIFDYKQKNISPHEILHIGDNNSADIIQAEKKGLKTGYVPRAVNILKSKREWNKLITTAHKTCDNTFLIGYLANWMFDDPYRPYASYSLLDGEVENLAYITAPLLLSFTKWMLEDAICEKIEQLLLTYRDGYIPEKLYNLLSPFYDTVPKIKPIYLSRKIRYVYMAKIPHGLLNSIIDLPVDPEISIKDFIENRLLITDELQKQEVLLIFMKHGYSNENTQIGKLEKYIHFLEELEPFFKNNANSHIENIKDYCLDSIKSYAKIAVFDIGYRSSVSRFLFDNLHIPNIGYQLFATSLNDIENTKNYTLKSYIQYGLSIPQNTIILHPLMEDIISIQEGSALSITKQSDKYIINKEELTNINQYITSIQDKILEYSTGFINLFNNDIPILKFDHYLHFELLINFLQKPCKKDAESILKLNFKDSSFISSGNKNIYQEWYNKFFNPIQNKIDITKNKGLKVIVYEKLDSLHLLPMAKLIYSPLKKLITSKSTNSSIMFSEYLTELECSIDLIEKSGLLNLKKNILVLGDMVSFDKGSCYYLNELHKILWEKEYNFVLLSEATLAPKEIIEKRIDFCHFTVPNLFGKNQYEPNIEIEIPKDIESYIAKSETLNWSIENWTCRHKDMTQSYAKTLAYYAEQYYSKAISKIQPSCIIMWNKFHALHNIINAIALKKNIPILYMEFGSLPGTFSFEALGQMGESYPAYYSEQFLKLPISNADLQHATDIWKYLKDSKLNRNIQPISTNKNDIFQKIDRKKPTILFAGQNDFESGLYPYTEETNKFHSPIFKSSDEAIIFLSELAQKNNWNLIYKPHPIMKLLNSINNKLPHNVIYIPEIDINDIIDFCDVTVTILSQTGYISAIREKATVMLGYTQLKEKGCTYEAYHINEIEQTIKEAILHGFTNVQKEAFTKHIAQLTKYYLFDDLSDKDIHYGKDIKKACELIENSINKDTITSWGEL